jgi:hypothetical protein
VLNKLNDKLKKILPGNGFEITCELSCRGFDTYGVLKFTCGINKGRPDERDLKNAAGFGRKINGKFPGYKKQILI